MHPSVLPALFALILTTGITSAVAAPGNGAALSAQVKSGEAIYSRCQACHALSYDRTGPRHCGLFGRRAGSVKGFVYSDAMKNSKIIWDAKTLDLFLTNPTKYIPGTAMGYAGVNSKKERSDLIAYLKQANASPECKP